MNRPLGAAWFLHQESRALLARLARVKPFMVQETMVPAANLAPATQIAIERFLQEGRGELRTAIRRFIRWLEGPGRRARPAAMQRRYTILKVRFTDILTQFDLFADAITQRSEQEIGLWLSGLDVVAADGLELVEGDYDMPPVICYLDRGAGAAIRRARTRLPGDKENPVAIVRVPRERMVGHGVASSLMHEVGHQGAALLDLVPSLRAEIGERQARAADPGQRRAWRCWGTWISEIVADFWSVAKVGVGSTLGLIAVVSLPPPFVFRFTLADPHPFPWIRVMLSATIGERVYPDRQWKEIRELWRRLYPVERQSPAMQTIAGDLERSMPALAELIAGHRPAKLRGLSLARAVRSPDRAARSLRALHQQWQADPATGRDAPPALALAVLGQARWDGLITPEQEGRQVGQLLTDWAVRSTYEAAQAAVDTQLTDAAPLAVVAE
jgi:hypothetical protein